MESDNNNISRHAIFDKFNNQNENHIYQVLENVNFLSGMIEDVNQTDQFAQNSNSIDSNNSIENISKIYVTDDSIEKMKNLSADTVDKILNLNKVSESLESSSDMIADEDILKHPSGFCASKIKTKRAGTKFRKWLVNYRDRLLKLKEDGLLNEYKIGELSRIEESIRNNSDELDFTVEKCSCKLKKYKKKINLVILKLSE